MTTRLYELVLMLDPEAADAERDRVADDVRKQIEAAGTLEQADNWGMRKMAYEIRQRNEADYRYYRFTGEKELLERLDHSLKIAEGTLRFRVFKVDPETPTAAPPPAERLSVATADSDDRGSRGRRPRRDDD
jgi:small subunit ribosomal protein S6